MRAPSSRLFLYLHGARDTRKLSVVLRAFIDESGTHGDDSNVVIVAAYVSPGSKWEHFKTAWARKLQGPGRPFSRTEAVDFHMKGFVQGKTPFVQWKHERKKALANDLVPIIRGHVEFGTYAAVSLPDLRRLAGGYTEFRIDPIRDSLVFGFEACLHEIVAKAPRRDGETISIVCDENQEMEYRIREHFNFVMQIRPAWRSIFTSFTFARREAESPLQAIDALTYEAYRNADDIVSGRTNPRPIRYFQELLNHHRTHGGLFTERVLRTMLERMRTVPLLGREEVGRYLGAEKTAKERTQEQHRAKQKKRGAPKGKG